MIRLLLALAVLLAAPAPAQTNWATHTVAAPGGGMVLGSPTARLKLVEYGSLTCPHCRDFHLAGATPLVRDYVARGLVSYEYRSLVLNGPDLAASVLARCDGPLPFFRRVGAFYRDQERWIAAFGQANAAAQARVDAAPEGQKLLVFAQVGGLDRYATATLGMPPARVRQCLLSTPVRTAVMAIGRAANSQGVSGTPTFFINGQRLDGNTWPFVEAALRARLGLAPKAG